MTRATFSPTTEPIDPPMNSKAKDPRQVAADGTPEMKASRRRVVLSVALSRSLYFLASVKPSGSCGVRSASSSWKVPGSSSRSKRRRTGSSSWWPQFGQTFQFFSRSAL